MPRLLRQPESTKGPLRRAGHGYARWLAAGLVLALGGCLVTEQFPFEAVDNAPEALAVNPPIFTRVPLESPIECPDGMRFDVRFVEPEAGQPVFSRLVINGELYSSPIEVPLAAPGAEYRVLVSPLCVPKSQFNRPCNRVQLATSNDLAKVVFRPPVDGERDARITVVNWFVLGSSRDFADANPSDCEQLLARDAGPSPFDRDGGTGFPASDGGL